MKIGNVRQAIRESHRRSRSWRQTGRAFGVTAGTARRIAEGYEPREAHIRHALGLPPLALAPTCPKCGAVHVSKRCTAQPRSYTQLFTMPPDELARRVREREPVE